MVAKVKPKTKTTAQKAKKNKEPKLFIRNAEQKDVPEIIHLAEKSYNGMPPYPERMISAQISHFPEGHFVAVYNNKIVGYCASIRISGKKCLNPHTWREITGGGYGSTHEAKGDYLYGYEVCVDPSIRNLKIGQRFYNERKKLAKYLRLKGIVIAGRLPKLKESIDKIKTIENYIKAVKDKKIKDSVLSFQLKNGFEVIGTFKNYLPHDEESMGHACHLIWKNPQYEVKAKGQIQIKEVKSHPTQGFVDSVRVATVQYGQRRIESFNEFKQLVEYYIDVVSDYKCDFVLFPELFSLQLLSIENEAIPPHEAIKKMTDYAPKLKSFYSKMAIKYNVNLIAGSHPVKMSNGDVQNISYICLRDGSIHEQAKIHPTPNEKYWWNIVGGDSLKPIHTDCGTIGVLICFDSEFPELSRHLVDQGIKILFVPFLTDERQGYCRVRYCSQARAVENEIYVVMSGAVGNLPRVQNMDIHYSQSCILTPCDFPFSRDGIAQEATPNVEMVAMADLRIDNLIEARNTGTVQILKNRRHDLYGVKWYNDK